jgi:HEAT repeat protein
VRTVVLPIAFAAALIARSASIADEPSVEEIFLATANADGSRYVVGRDVLLTRGDAAFAVAKVHAADADPGRRALAGLLRVRHDLPAECAAWSEALGSWNVEIATDAGRTTVRFPRYGPRNEVVETRVVDFPPDAVAVLIDTLRDERSASNPNRKPNAARIAAALRVADAAPWLVREIPQFGWLDEKIADALVALGDASLPPLRAALDDNPGERAATAATLLGRLRDRESAPKLRRILGRTQTLRVAEACALALVATDPEGGVQCALDRLLAFDEAINGRSRSQFRYGDARAVVFVFGDAVLAAARARLEAKPGPLVRARLEGIAWELTSSAAAAALYAPLGKESLRGIPYNADKVDPADLVRRGRAEFWNGWSHADGPMPLILERAAAIGATRDLVRAARVAEPLASAVVHDVLLSAAARGYGADALAALATTSPSDALDVLDRYVSADPPEDLACCVEALLLLLDDPQAKAIVERIVAPAHAEKWTQAARIYGEAAPLARAALAVTRGERSLADLLGDASDGVRLSAARALARRGDAAGVPILAAKAIEARGPWYLSLRDDLVRSGRAPDVAADDVRSRVLHDAVAARIADPALARAVEEAWQRRIPVVLDILGPQPEHFEKGGEGLAKDVGLPGLPLVEEAALFLDSLVSIHALGVLGDDRSIPVLVRVARRLPSPAAAALRRMGEKGLAAAREIPPPDPEKPEYGDRASRREGAAETLAGAPGGIEKVLEGLAETAPAARDEWRSRMQGYLRLAGSTADPRIVEPVLRILREHGPGDRYLADAAIEALAKVRDPRIAEACLPYLPTDQFDQERSDEGPARRALLEQLGDGTWWFLRQHLDASQPGKERARIAHAMFRETFAPSRSRSARDATAAALRGQLGEAAADLSAGAAWDLVRLHFGRSEGERDPADVAALLDFVRTHARPGLAVDEIAKQRVDGAGEAFLDSFAIAHDPRPLYGLGTLGFEPAAETVAAVFEKRLGEKDFVRDGWMPQEISELPKLGAEGRRRARAFLMDSAILDVRIAAACALAETGDRESFDGARAVLDAVDAASPMRGEKPVNRRRAMEYALGKLDPARAHAEFVRRSLAARDESLARTYADAAESLLRNHPEIAAPAPK